MDNVIARIIREKLGDKIKLDDNNFKQVNFFKPKVYEDFFNKASNTFVIMIECKSEVEFKEYKFNELIPSQPQTDDLMEEKLKSLINESLKMVEKVIDYPSTITENDVKRIATLHGEIYSFEKFGFYKEFFEYFVGEERKHFSEIIEKIPDKEALDCQEECVVVLTVSRIKDLVNYTNKFFHIDEHARDIWDVVEKKI